MRVPTLALALLFTLPCSAQEAGELMQRVVRVLERSFHDREFRTERLPAIASPFLARANAARSVEEEKELVDELLGLLPASHLALYSRTTYKGMLAELMGERQPTIGMQLVELDDGFFADWLLEDGAAARAGVLRGDRVISIDGVEVGASPRLDWSSDDAALPDPPTHKVLCEEGDVVALRIQRSSGAEARTITIRAVMDSGFEAMQRTVRTYEVDGQRVGYVHLWYIHHRDQARFLRRAIQRNFADCDGLVIDLRGRGGSATEAQRIIELFDDEKGAWRKPLALLVDRGTRSAKEVIAYELARRDAAMLVGEKTPGAVIPASFEDVGAGMVLMFPSFTLGNYTRAIEGVGVPVDFEARYALAYTAGKDAILSQGLRVAAAWAAETVSAVEPGKTPHPASAVEPGKTPHPGRH